MSEHINRATRLIVAFIVAFIVGWAGSSIGVATATGTCTKPYTVQAGDSWSSIASSFGIPAGNLVRFNGGRWSAPPAITPGQVICIGEADRDGNTIGAGSSTPTTTTNHRGAAATATTTPAPQQRPTKVKGCKVPKVGKSRFCAVFKPGSVSGEGFIINGDGTIIDGPNWVSRSIVDSDGDPTGGPDAVTPMGHITFNCYTSKTTQKPEAAAEQAALEQLLWDGVQDTPTQRAEWRARIKELKQIGTSCGGWPAAPGLSCATRFNDTVMMIHVYPVEGESHGCVRNPHACAIAALGVSDAWFLEREG